MRPPNAQHPSTDKSTVAEVQRILRQRVPPWKRSILGAIGLPLSHRASFHLHPSFNRRAIERWGETESF